MTGFSKQQKHVLQALGLKTWRLSSRFQSQPDLASTAFDHTEQQAFENKAENPLQVSQEVIAQALSSNLCRDLAVLSGQTPEAVAEGIAFGRVLWTPVDGNEVNQTSVQSLQQISNKRRFLQWWCEQQYAV